MCSSDLGDKIRYLAPSQRSILSIVFNAHKSRQTQNNRKTQPGVFVTKFKGYHQFKIPWTKITLVKKKVSQKVSDTSQIKTVFIEGPGPEIPLLPITANNYNQALIWLIYR